MRFESDFQETTMARKIFSSSSTLFIILLTIGSFFGTYNLITMVMHNKTLNPRGLFDDLNYMMPDNMKRSTGTKALFHVALTATDKPYSKWQSRIMYYWYQRMKNVDGSEMGNFTRILHSGRPDNLMDEIPTFVVDPLPSDRVRNRIFFFPSIYLTSCIQLRALVQHVNTFLQRHPSMVNTIKL